MYLGSCAYLRFCALLVFGLVYVVVVCCLVFVGGLLLWFWVGRCLFGGFPFGLGGGWFGFSVFGFVWLWRGDFGLVACMLCALVLVVRGVLCAVWCVVGCMWFPGGCSMWMFDFGVWCLVCLS